MSALKVLPIAGVLLALGLPVSASAQGIELINRCDRVCSASPKAICYQACFAGGGHAYKPAPKRPMPVSVLRAVEADWKQAVYNHSFNSRGGTGGNGGGGGGKGK